MSTDRYENTQFQSEFQKMKLLYISCSQPNINWHSTLHAHSCTEMFYVMQGQVQFQIEEVVFTVQKNDMVIINPNVAHTERMVDSHPINYMVAGFEGGRFLMEGSDDSRYCAFGCGSEGEVAVRLMDAILQELREQQEHASLVADKLFEVLCIIILRSRALYEKPGTTQGKAYVCERVKEYMDNHYMENITLDTLAGIAFLNKYYLAHTFTKEFGLSPINYLIQRRIDESRYLLTNTNTSISQISSILGFSSPSYFTQVFQKSQGESPKEFRKRAQEAADTEEYL